MDSRQIRERFENLVRALPGDGAVLALIAASIIAMMLLDTWGVWR